jgi:hypothetical protein
VCLLEAALPHCTVTTEPPVRGLQDQIIRSEQGMSDQLSFRTAWRVIIVSYSRSRTDGTTEPCMYFPYHRR